VLTFFTTAKPFVGHAEIIQRNALKSWTLMHPHAEVILFGDEHGAAEVARELGIRHEPHVERSEFGTKRLDYLFSTARAIARHDVLCYVNCDIVLTQDFRRAMKDVQRAHEEFLMVGRRWDLEVWEPLDFTRANWQSRLQAAALSRGRQRPAEWIDYFAFSRALYKADIPPLVIGRVHWDNWLLWKARNIGAAVVDASDAVIAVHQNHDYRYHPQGREGVWNDCEAAQNYRLTGGWRHLRTIADATEVLEAEGLRVNTKRHWKMAKRYAGAGLRGVRENALQPLWFSLLGITRPVRHALGLRQPGLQQRSRGNA
jgi:hypothetical protein